MVQPSQFPWVSPVRLGGEFCTPRQEMESSGPEGIILWLLKNPNKGRGGTENSPRLPSFTTLRIRFPSDDVIEPFLLLCKNDRSIDRIDNLETVPRWW